MWNYLGTFNFDAATGGTVKLSATGSPSITVCADAVKFVYVEGRRKFATGGEQRCSDNGIWNSGDHQCACQ
jgi:hypothetical protein